jgi:hypothetical protein
MTAESRWEGEDDDSIDVSVTPPTTIAAAVSASASIEYVFVMFASWSRVALVVG